MLTPQVQGRKVWKRQRNPIKRKTVTFFINNEKFIQFLFSSIKKTHAYNSLVTDLL